MNDRAMKLNTLLRNREKAKTALFYATMLYCCPECHARFQDELSRIEEEIINLANENVTLTVSQ